MPSAYVEAQHRAGQIAQEENARARPRPFANPLEAMQGALPQAPAAAAMQGAPPMPGIDMQEGPQTPPFPGPRPQGIPIAQLADRGPVGGPLGPMPPMPGAPPIAGQPPQQAQTPLDSLREQMSTLRQLTGSPIGAGGPMPAAPQAPGYLAGAPGYNQMMAAAHGADVQGYGHALAAQTSDTNSARGAQSQLTGDLLGRLGTMGTHALGLGDLNLRTIGQLGLPASGGNPAIPGRMQNEAEAAQAGSLERMRETQLGAMYAQGLAAHQASGGTPESFQEQWSRMGLPVPAFLSQQTRPGGTPGAPGGPVVPPPGVQTTTTAPGGQSGTTTAGRTTGGDVRSLMQQRYEAIRDRVLGRQAPGQNRAPTTPEQNDNMISQLILDTHNTASNPLQNSLPHVRDFLTNTFGEDALNHWMARSINPITGTNDPVTRSRAIFNNAVNARNPGTVGTRTGGVHNLWNLFSPPR